MTKEENLKKLILKSQYIVEEFEDTKEKMAKYTEQLYKDFPEEYERMLNSQNPNPSEDGDKENNETIENEEEGENEENNESIEDEDEEEHQTSDEIKPASMKKLYRRISKVTHPDKVDSEFLTSYFKKASTAYSENNISELFTIASFLNIDTSDIDRQEIINELKSDIFTKEFYIACKKSSLAWRWAHAKTEEQKEELRKILKEYTEKNY